MNCIRFTKGTKGRDTFQAHAKTESVGQTAWRLYDDEMRMNALGIA